MARHPPSIAELTCSPETGAGRNERLAGRRSEHARGASARRRSSASSTKCRAVTLVKDVRREHGIPKGIYNRWKDKYLKLDISEARRLRELEQKNRRMKARWPT